MHPCSSQIILSETLFILISTDRKAGVADHIFAARLYIWKHNWLEADELRGGIGLAGENPQRVCILYRVDTRQINQPD